MQSSGLFKNDDFNLTQKNSISNLFSGSNLSLGFDTGFTYRFNKRVKISAGILDIGFIRNSKEVNSLKMSGDYSFDGIGLLESDDEPFSYWEDFKLDFYEQVNREELSDAYFSSLTAKLNASVNYGFGKEIIKLSNAKDCHANTGFSSYNYQNELGVQLYSVFRPKLPQTAVTLYYSRRVANFLHAKLTYTADSYSYSNIGLGFSTQIKKLNLYASADNLLGYSDLYNTKKCH